MFQVDQNYKLPYKYDTAEIANSSTINPDSFLVYSFIVKSNTSERKSLTNVVLQQVAAGREPLEILDTKTPNGSCNLNPETKTVKCTLSYSFTDSAHYPLEFLVKIKGSAQETNTSSMFTVTTNVGSASCANFLRIKPVPTIVNPIKWETPYAALSASDFYIRIGNQKFYGKEPIYLHSDPGVDKTTLEAIWRENDVEMRLFLYFRKIENTMWEMYDMRSYNGRSPGDWLNTYKDSLGNEIKSTIGYHNYAASRTFVPTGNQDAEIFCKSCEINAFLPKPLPTTAYGYSLEPLIGLPQGKIITFSNDPRGGYGVNVILRDSHGQTVTNQADFTYQWSTENPQIVSMTPGTLDYGNNTCAYGILPPCPFNHVDLKGLLPGQTNIIVKVVRQTDQAVIAQTSFPVKVIEARELTQIPTPNPSTTLSPQEQELIRVKQDLTRISQELESQKKSVSALNKLVEAIRYFLEKIFGRIINK